MSELGVLLLAGGASTRMGPGRDKLLEPIKGEPLLRRQARLCLSIRARPVIVVLPPDRPERDAVLKGLDVERRHNSGSQHGLAQSLRIGLENAQFEAVMIVLADLPELTTDDLLAVIHAARETSAIILRGASADGRPGHPVLIRKTLFKELEQMSGDTGAAPVLERYRDQTKLVALPENHAITDLDTPRDWAVWRAQNPGK